MRPATALSLRLRVTPAVLLGVVFVACKASDAEEPANLGTDGGDSCIADTSKGAASAVVVTSEQAGEGMVCPRTDRDWFAVDVPEGQDLVDLSASYAGSLTKVHLVARLYGADGTTPVEGGEVADTSLTSGKSVAQSTLHVATAGRYYLEVGDVGDQQADAYNTYVLSVGFATDPDTHEPNGTTADAKPVDAAPSFIGFRADVDVFRATVGASGLLGVVFENPVGARAALNYDIADATGRVLASGQAPPSATPLDVTRAVGAAGEYFVSVRYPADAQPDRRPEAGYRVTLTAPAEPDTNESPTRNDSALSATCPGGGAGPCTTTFTGAAVVLPQQKGYVASVGDSDYYRIDVASSAPAVLEMDLVAGVAKVDFVLDLLTPHAGSTCTKDADCTGIALACTSNDDCELSHQCLDEDDYALCAKKPCRLCAGAGACVPAGARDGARVCAVAQFSAKDADGGQKLDAAGTNRVRTALPLFATGPYYVVVHALTGAQYDPAAGYTLDLRVVPEPDARDRGEPAQRNNFYNPYPLRTTDLEPSKKRAQDISAQVAAGTAVSGFISYASDEDWFSFAHPCPGLDCGLQFEWVQPGPSRVRPVFLMRTSELGLHESWTYTGTTPPTALSGPVTDTFGDGDCSECSFASRLHGVASTDGGTSTAAAYQYYLQVRDYGADDWDSSATGAYQFRLKTVTTGCPVSCSERGGTTCACYCRSQNTCPAGPEL